MEAQAKDWKIPLVKIANFAAAARRAVSDNPFIVASILIALFAVSGLVALSKRRGVVWAELKIAKNR